MTEGLTFDVFSQAGAERQHPFVDNAIPIPFLERPIGVAVYLCEVEWTCDYEVD